MPVRLTRKREKSADYVAKNVEAANSVATVKFLRYNHNVWKKCVRFCQPALSVDRAVHRKFFPWHLTMDCMVSQDSGKKRKRCPVRPLQKVEKGEAHSGRSVV